MRKLCAVLALSFVLFAFSGVNAVSINEVNPVGTDWLEIYNPENETLDLSAWLIRDNSASNPDSITCWKIPDCNLTTTANYFLILGRNINISDVTNLTISYFYVDDLAIGNGLADTGDNLTFYSNSNFAFFNYTHALSGKSWQRIPDGSDYMESCYPTPGYENTCDASPDEPQTTSDSCDLQLKINASSIYNAGGDINYKLVIEDIKCSNVLHHYSVSYEIEDLFGNHLSSPRTSDYDINCRDTSSHNKQADEICGISAYKIKARLTDSGCDDLNSDNDGDEFIFVVKGNDPAECTASALENFQNSELFPSKTSNKYSGEITSFYTLAKNLYTGREINLFTSIENSANFSQRFELVLENMKKTIEIPPKSSQKANFSVILPSENINFNLQLFKDGSLLDEKSLLIELENAPQELESYNKTAPAAVIWVSEKISSLNLAMVFLIAVLLVFVFALLASKTKQNDLN